MDFWLLKISVKYEFNSYMIFKLNLQAIFVGEAGSGGFVVL